MVTRPEIPEGLHCAGRDPGTAVLAVLVLLMTSAPIVFSDSSDLAVQQLFQAATRDDASAVVGILDEGMDIDVRDKNGRSALLIATHHNAINTARTLIQRGADVNARDEIHDSPYLYAGAEGRLEILRLTLVNGADLSSVNRYGGTALIPAAHHGHVETVRELLNTDIDIDHVNNLGWTALLEAVILGDGSETYVDIVKLLVEAGADKNIGDRDGLTPMDHAINSGYPEIVSILSSPDSG